MERGRGGGGVNINFIIWFHIIFYVLLLFLSFFLLSSLISFLQTKPIISLFKREKKCFSYVKKMIFCLNFFEFPNFLNLFEIFLFS